MTLNLANFKTVIDDQFGKDTSLNTTLWSDNWGYKSQYSFGGGALTLTGNLSQDWYPVGFKQATPAKTAGEGYGLYQFSGYGNPGQGIGIAFLMWRADNVFLDGSTPGKATEIDILESWDRSKTVESTVHYYDSGWKSDNGQSYNAINVDPTKLHTYAMDWERGSLTYYVDGKQFYQDTVHAPLDAADGGSNEVMGAEVIYEASLVTTPTVQLHITEMSYSAPIAAGAPVPTLRLSAPGSLQEASPGAGVTVVETITTTNLTGSVYDEVLTASGAVETPYKAVALTGGSTSVSVHLAKSGDSIRVVDNIASPKVTATSSAVTITDPITTTPKFLISGVTEDNGRILISGDKEIGKAATMREFMDGKFIGVLRDGLIDGVFAIHAADVTVGKHELKLALDGYQSSAIFDFTKTATTIQATPASTTVLPSTGQSAGALVATLADGSGQIVIPASLH